jgi:aryl-alcohol dehydrogenase-like predicted oxidoreductase
MIEGCATGEGTKRYAERFTDAAAGHFRAAQKLTLSSVGIGTYLGNWDAETDAGYTEAIARFVELGGNVIDTAANYRFQRSERNIGAALAALFEKGFSRDEIFVCTKGGYLPFDGEPPRNVRAYFEETFVKTGIASFEDLAGGSHCMTPRYLQSQIDQSRRNMNLDCLDLFYLHNPESQLGETDRSAFEARLAAAFEKLEENRAAGRVRFYGVATWNGFRVSPQNPSFHSLEKMFKIAAEVGGSESHGFRFIQLPFNLAMPEALLARNQQAGGRAVSTLEAARELGVNVMTSASILQGKLAAGLPGELRRAAGNLDSDAQTSLQFVRSTPGVTTALVGMSRARHVEENMKLVKIEPLDQETYGELFTRE